MSKDFIFFDRQVVRSSLWEIQLLFRHHVETPGEHRVFGSGEKETSSDL